MRLLLSVFLIISCICGTRAQGQSVDAVHFLFDAQSLDGKLYSLSDNDKQVNRAFVFLSTSCPISNSYISELNRLTQALPPGVELFGVLSEPTTSRQNASKHFAEYKAEFPILFDGSQLLLDVLKPTHVPECDSPGLTDPEARGMVPTWQTSGWESWDDKELCWTNAEHRLVARCSC